MLLFTHIIPPLPFDALDGPYLGDAPRVFHGRIRVGHDGDLVTLPVGSIRIRLTNRLNAFN
jgi:ribonuclease Z